MKYLDVCSGFSAFTLASADLGFECAGYAEIDAFPSAVLGVRYGATRPRYMPAIDPDLPAKDRKERERMAKSVASLSDSHFGNQVINFGDFTQIRDDDVGPIDLLTGGTPCQAFSIAGKRLGLDDPRGNLTLEFLALAKRVRPRWILWENVAGILSHDDGRTLGTFLRILGHIGYGWAYRVLDVQYVRVDGFPWAIPQRRRRVFVVGYLGNAARAAAVLFDRESLLGNSAPCRQAGQGVAPTISARTKGGGGLGTDFDLDGELIHCAEIAPTLNAAFGSKLGLENQHIDQGGDCLYPPVSLCLNAGAMGRLDAESETLIPVNRCGIDVAHTLKAEGFDGSEDGSGRGVPLIPIAFDTTQITSATNYSNPKSGDPCHPLAAGGHPPAICYSIMPMNSGKDYKARKTDVAQPIMAGGPVGGNQGGDYVAYRITPNDGAYETGDIVGSLTTGTDNSAISLLQNLAVRRLTPTECARLMGVPDDFLRISYRGKVASDGPIYKALGNSQGVNVMRWITRGIAEVDSIPQ